MAVITIPVWLSAWQAGFEVFLFLTLVRQAIYRLPLVLKTGFTPSGAAMAPLDAFVCPVMNGVAGVFGGVVSSVRDWRVSGVRIVRVGRLLARATNCRPLIRFIFAPKIELALLGHDPWFLCCLPHCMENFVRQPRTCPPCGFAAAMWTSKAVPTSRTYPLTLCCGCLGPQDNCSCSRMWKIKRTSVGVSASCCSNQVPR